MITNNQVDQGEVKQVLCSVSVVVTEKNNLPCIKLIKEITDTELIKSIISCAFHDRPVILMPKFTDKIKSIGSLVDKGILYRKDNDFYFMF